MLVRQPRHACCTDLEIELGLSWSCFTSYPVCCAGQAAANQQALGTTCLSALTHTH